MAPKKNARVGIYARVSTGEQNPRMQLKELREYARNLDVVGEFVDKESGAKDRRPELDRLWCLVRGRKVDAVLVWRFDRFARSTKQLVDALEEMNHLGVDFISLHEQIDTSSPMGKAMFTIVSAISEFEREIIRERVPPRASKKAQGILGEIYLFRTARRLKYWGRPSEIRRPASGHVGRECNLRFM